MTVEGHWINLLKDPVWCGKNQMIAFSDILAYNNKKYI